MRNKVRKVSRFTSRIFTLLLAAVMLLTSINLIAIFGDSMRRTLLAAEALSNVTVRDDALHFIIRHWKTVDDDEAMLQSGEADENGNHFVMIEGYIMSKEKGSGKAPFEYYLVDQSSGELVKTPSGSTYIGGFNTATGALILNVKLLSDSNDDEDVEVFSGFSISAGHGAVTYAEDNSYIVITYSPSIHLVKGHVFYTDKVKIVRGVNDEQYQLLFGNGSDGIDTVEVYTWRYEVENHKAGDIVLRNNEACKTRSDLPEGAYVDEYDAETGKLTREGNVELTRFYSNSEGMHTNKALVQSNEDDRLFLFDLEAWYAEGYASQIGLMLDSSGGMAAASDTPIAINVYDFLAAKLGVTEENGTDSAPTYSYDRTIDGQRIRYTGVASKKALLEQFHTEHAEQMVQAFNERTGTGITEEDLQEVFDKIGYQTGSEDWYEAFLGDEALTVLMNPRNTDNSPIGANGFSYYTYSSIGYSPLGYWAGVEQVDTESGYQFTPNPDAGISGLSFSNNRLSMKDSAGIVLDTKPQGDFTLSFTLKRDSASDPANADKKIKELLYIGPMSSETGSKDGGYFKLFRALDSSSARLRGNDSADTAATLVNYNRVFDNTTEHTITLVFQIPEEPNDQGKYSVTVVTYLDSTTDGSAPNTGATFDITDWSDLGIVFNGIQDNYSDTTAADIYLDNIRVVDKALSASEITSLKSADTPEKWRNVVNKDTDGDLLLGFYSFTSGTRLLNEANETTSAAVLQKKLAISNSYNPGAFDSGKNNDLGIVFNGRSIAQATFIAGNAGWYFISHRSYLNSDGTARRMFGLYGEGGITITDEVNDPNGAINGEGNTAARFSPKTHGEHIQFYIDGAGYLRCFYGSGETQASHACSYVYELTDAQYTKVEALQRILANFTTKLMDRSLGSEVSAVRFSGSANNDGKYLPAKLNDDGEFNVMLDWTGDPAAISGIMSQTRGNAQFDGGWAYTESARGIKQFNYALTGGTNLGVGLNAFTTYLADYKNEAKGAKFMVLFTDGQATELTNFTSNGDRSALDELFRSVKELKEKGYTFISVFCPESGMDPDTEKSATQFLKQVAGDYTDLDNDEDAGEPYFYSAKELDALMDRFEKDILSLMAKRLEGYTVKDYIDPRFNLVSQGKDGSAGSVWQLLASGQIVVEGTPQNVINDLMAAVKAGTIDKYETTKEGNLTFKLKETGFPFSLIGTTNSLARRPMLHYDENRDMYYLEWIDQVIPTGSTDAEKLAIWNAQIMLQAKGDFIGGNAVTTNGNEEKMNWVYHPLDSGNEDEATAYVTRRKNELGATWDSLTKAGKQPVLSKEDYVADHLEDGLTDEEIDQRTAELEAEYDALVASGHSFKLSKEEYIERNLKEYVKVAAGDASSGTDDMYKEYPIVTDEAGEPVTDNDGNYVYDKEHPIDEYPSKGFPRPTLNVPLTIINVNHLDGVLFEGELISPAQLLGDIEDRIISHSYYLEYLQRYAYQRYIYNMDTMSADWNMPLLDLLHQWLEFKNEEAFEKSFSIPYMYLPEVAYTKDGTIELDGKFATILNSAGNTFYDEENEIWRFDALNADVLGILTYRWEQIEPDPDPDKDGTGDKTIATKDFVKADTERTVYGITVGFTPLRVGDDLKLLNEHDDLYDPDPEKSDPIFAGFIPIKTENGDELKTSWDDFVFDREEILNGSEEKGTTGYIKDTDFKWDPEYKPATFYAEQLQNMLDKYTGTPDTVQLINEGRIIDEETGEREYEGDPRTLKGYAIYSLDVVGGGIALELNMLKGELEKFMLDADGSLNKTFQLDATRSFTDTDFAEKQKSAQKLADFGRFGSKNEDNAIYHFTFTFDYTDKEIKDILDAAQVSENGNVYVQVYAKATNVTATLEGTDAGDKTVTLTELPIGSYTFALSDAQKSENAIRNIGFSSISFESDGTRFKAEYFHEHVQNGRATTNEIPDSVWREWPPVKEPSDNPVYKAEINDDNIADYLAQGVVDTENQTATVCIGTTVTSDKRGSTDDENRYTDDRLGIIVLSTGAMKLTIFATEKGDANESFLYRITGTTLGDEKVDLIVSVKSGGHTSVWLLAGEYEVEELTNWSWRYKPGSATGAVAEWNITAASETLASVAKAWLYSDMTEKDENGIEGAKLYYAHTRNDKNWAGGESSTASTVKENLW